MGNPLTVGESQKLSLLIAIYSLSRNTNMTSKKVVLSADSTTATVSDAVLSDVFSTALTTNSAVTGLYGLAQKAGLVVIGMGIQNKRVGGSLNPF